MTTGYYRGFKTASSLPKGEAGTYQGPQQWYHTPFVIRIRHVTNDLRIAR